MPNLQNEPLAADLRAFLGDTPGAASASEESLSLLLSSATLAFQSDTNLTPLLAAPDAGPTTRTLRARNGMVNFGAPLLRLDGVMFGNVPLENLGWGGFALMPENEPIASYLVLDVQVSTMPGSVQVLGVWGAFLVLPDDIKEALLCRAACLFLAQAGLSPTLGGLIAAPGSVKRRQDEDIAQEVTTGAEGGANSVLAERGRSVAAMRQVYAEAVKRHRLL